jgi:hypothetical protein
MRCDDRTWIVAATGAAACIAGTAAADLVGTWTVGTGSSSSFVQIEFGNGNTYLYECLWDGTMTGQGLFELIEGAQTGYFAYEVVSFSFGDALFGITAGGDTDAGFGTPPEYLDYWHYWTREGGGDWNESFVGFGDRAVVDGSWDGWVFDSASAPSVVPAPGTCAILALAARRRRRR